MTKGEIIFIVGIFGSLLLSLAMTLSYYLYTNAQNRQAYMECLRVTERILQEDRGSGVRIVSSPNCRL